MAMNITELYRKQLLWGNEFLSRYQVQLDTLYADTDFKAVIHKIQKCGPLYENDETIEELKRAAKTTLFSEKAVFNFPVLKEIVDDVAAQGNARNSALISAYLAMRLYKASGPVPETKEVQLRENEADFRLKWRADDRCEDGHYVRSKNEMLVDNWLYYHEVCHAYEKSVFSKVSQQAYCSNFFLPQYKLFIEIWGMTDVQYEARKQRKIAFYQQNEYDLLQILGGGVKNLDDILSRAIHSRKKS